MGFRIVRDRDCDRRRLGEMQRGPNSVCAMDVNGQSSDSKVDESGSQRMPSSVCCKPAGEGVIIEKPIKG